MLVPSPAFPASHGVQEASNVGVHSEAMKKPTPQTSHAEHEGLPELGWKVRAGHAVQSSLEPVL